MSINPDTLTVLDEYRAAATTITDSQTRTLVTAWADAWNSVADELDDALAALTADGVPTRAQVRRSRRLAAALDSIAAQLEDLAARAGVTIVSDLPTAVQLAGTTNAALLTSQLPPIAGAAALVVSWDRVDPRAVAAIITRTTQRIHASTWPLADQAVAAMRVNLIRGLAAGDNPRATAARMLRDTGGTFGGGLARALTLARTETLDAMRAATTLSNRANAAVLGGWTWTASLGPRTCPACWSMHGTDFPLDAPGPEGHPNCRCTAVPRAKTWAELGFTGIDEPPSLLPNAQAVFDALTPAEQLEILGPARFRAWQAGDYPMGTWAVRRDNPDWRPSWHVSAAPKAAAVA